MGGWGRLRGGAARQNQGREGEGKRGQARTGQDASYRTGWRDGWRWKLCTVRPRARGPTLTARPPTHPASPWQHVAWSDGPVCVSAAGLGRVHDARTSHEVGVTLGGMNYETGNHERNKNKYKSWIVLSRAPIVSAIQIIHSATHDSSSFTVR